MDAKLSRGASVALLASLLLAASVGGPVLATPAEPADGSSRTTGSTAERGERPVSAPLEDRDGFVGTTFRGEPTVESASLGEPTVESAPQDEPVIETEYARIEYHQDYEAEAERIAAVVDDHYEQLHQLFSLYPPEERIEVRIAPEDETPCDTTGCIGPLGAVYLSSGSRSLLHHELVHVIQLREHWSVTNWLTPPEPAEGALIEGTAEYLATPSASLARRARFDPAAINLTTHPDGSSEYAERALFVEFVLADYGRDAFDALYVEGDVAGLEAATGTDYEALRAEFEDQLDDQRERLRDGGAVLPAFTYDPVLVTPGEAVTFDARTPSTVAAFDREWYPEDPDAVAWDLTGDGTVDATGPTVAHTFDDAGPHDVTLFVTVDGEEHVATQRVLTTVQPAIRLVDADLPSRLENDDIAVEATVHNPGQRPASTTATYAVDGGTVIERTVDLAPGERRTIDLRGGVPADLEDGTYDHAVTVGDASVEATITVDRVADGADETSPAEGASDATENGTASSDSSARETERGADEGGGDGLPGFGSVAALAAILAFSVCRRAVPFRRTRP